MHDQLQRSWLRARFSLPSPLLRAMSGGAAVVREGRSLDPRLQYLSHLDGASSGMTPDEARARDEKTTALLAPPLEKGVGREDLTMAGPTGAGLSLRLYRPADQIAQRGAILYLHGGGGVIGDLGSGGAFCAILAKLTGAPVLSLDYRLAPEHRFPAGLEDALAAYRWLLDQGDRFGARPGQVALAGASIGGGFAAAICQQLRELGEAQPKLQILLYPMVDLGDPALRAPATFEAGWPLSLPGMAWSRDHYLGVDSDPADPRLSPLRTTNLSGLAPALIATAGFDPLRGQALTYAKALSAAGVTTTYRQYDSLTHDFAAFTDLVPAADRACREIANLAGPTLDG